MSIDQAVAEAIQNNLDLLAERQNVPVSKAREITAALRPNPVVTFGWDYLDWLRRGLSAANSAGPSEWNARVDYLLEGPGKRTRRVELAQRATSVAELRLLDAVRLLGLNVRLACVDYLVARENVELASQNLRVFHDIVQVNEARVKAGDLAGVELIRARVAQQQLQTAVDQARLKLRTSSNQLQQLLGRKEKNGEFTIGGALRDDSVILLLDELKSQALDQRPDYRAGQNDLLRARADARLQQTNGKIDYTLSTEYHNQYGYSNGRTFGVFLSIPLPVYNRNQGEIVRSEREAAQSEMRSRAQSASIATEVENAWQQYSSAKSLLERIRGGLLGDARQVREITEFSYRRGEASLLEFLDAQRAYNDAMQSYNDARADYMRSRFLIDAVTGKSVNP